jgi:hypothetical protein
MFKWQRRDGAWHLWRGVEAIDGAVLWQETGYLLYHHRRRPEYWIARQDDPGLMMLCLASFKDAKAYAENLAQNSCQKHLTNRMTYAIICHRFEKRRERARWQA